MANNIIKRVWNQNRMVNIEDLCGMAFQAEAGGHTFQIFGVDDTGAAVPLSGTVAGVFRRPDNADIALTGASTGGVASVTLTEDCYAVPGFFGLTIFVTSGGQKTAVYAAVGTVAVTSGGAVAGETPQDVVDLINAIAAAVATIPADYTDLMAAIAPTYSSSSLYAVGSYVWHDGHLYRCTTPITTAETWTAAHWTAAVLGDDVGGLKNQIESYPNSIGAVVGATPYPFTRGFYTTPASGDAVEYRGDSDAVCVKIPVTVGDVITLNASAGTGIGRLYVFIDSNGNAIGRCETNLSGIRTLTEIPTGAVYLAINNMLSKQQSGYYAYKGNSVDNRFATTKADQTIASKTNDTAVGKITGAYPLTFRGGVYLGVTTGSVMDGVPTDDDEFICAECSCTSEDTITINGNGSSGRYRMWYIVDAENVVVWSANDNVSGVQRVEPPTNGVKIYVNLLRTSENPYAYNGRSIADLPSKVDALEETVGALSVVIPSYYTDGGYLQEQLDTITNIQKNMSLENDAFWLISDYHYRYNSGNSIPLLKYLSDRTGIMRLHYDGDAGGSEGTTADARLHALQHSAKVWADLEKCVPEMYGVLGNHEWIASDVFNMGTMMGAYLNRFKTKVPEFNAECGAYYIDNAANKIRYFFIQDTISSYPVSPSVAWLEAQLGQLPSGYAVAVFVHHGYIPSAYTEEEYGFSVTYNYGSIKQISTTLKTWRDGDPSNRSVIGVFCAHMHHSTLYNGAAAWALDNDTYGITVFRASEDALNENAIAINNHPWFWWYNEATGEYEKKERTPGTIYEQCFYCIQIDKTNKHLYITAIGGDRNWDCVYES